MNMQKIKRPRMSVWEKLNRSTWILVILLLISWSVVFIMAKDKQQLRDVSLCEDNNQPKQGAVAGAEADTMSALEQLANIMELPPGQPTVATVKDAVNLKTNQDFFTNAENGDKVLFFSTMSILFRPDTGRIINIGSMQSKLAEAEGDQADGYVPESREAGMEEEEDPELSDNADNQAVVPEKISIELRNGSWVAGLAGRWSRQLEQKGYQVEEAANASRHDYSRTVLVNQSEAGIAELVELTGGEIRDSLPMGEAASQADVIIILSKESNL